MSDVRPHNLFIQPYRGHKITSRPKILAREIPGLTRESPGYANGTLAFDKSHYITHRVLGRNADTHVNVIGHQMALHNLAFLLLRQLMQHASKVLAHRSKYRLLSPFRDKYHVVFAVPARVRQALVLFHPMLLFLGRNRSIYDRTKRSNLCESPGIAGGLPYNELDFIAEAAQRGSYPRPLALGEFAPRDQELLLAFWPRHGTVWLGQAALDTGKAARRIGVIVPL